MTFWVGCSRLLERLATFISLKTSQSKAEIIKAHHDKQKNTCSHLHLHSWSSTSAFKEAVLMSKDEGSSHLAHILRNFRSRVMIEISITVKKAPNRLRILIFNPYASSQSLQNVNWSDAFRSKKLKMLFLFNALKQLPLSLYTQKQKSLLCFI